MTFKLNDQKKIKGLPITPLGDTDLLICTIETKIYSVRRSV